MDALFSLDAPADKGKAIQVQLGTKSSYNTKPSYVPLEEWPKVLMIEAPLISMQHDPFQEGIMEEVNYDEEEEGASREGMENILWMRMVTLW